MSKNEPSIGIDLGATNVRAGLVENGELTDLQKKRLPKDKSVDSILSIMADLVESVDNGVSKIGIGVPSVVDSNKGIVYNVQNIQGWEEVHLKKLLEQKTGKEVYLNNDANCFALGEYLFGVGRGSANLVGLTIGTGFAGGIMINGQIYEGQNCGAGEFGMVPYRASILEHYCSGQYFSRFEGRPGEEIYDEAVKGDPESKKIFYTFGQHLANAVKIVLYTYDPDTIIFGGSIGKTYDQFREGFENELNNYGFPSSLNNLQIKVSQTDHIAVLGAAALTFNQRTTN